MATSGNLCKSKNVNVPPGANGKDGRPFSVPIPTSVGGAAGTALVVRKNYNAVSSLVGTEYVDLLLHAAEIDFLNSDFSTAGARLIWINNLLTAAHGESTKTGLVAKYFNQMVRARTLMRYLVLGVDYFGNTQNHVFLLSVAFYEASVKQLLAYAEKIEKEYSSYHSASQRLEGRINSLQEARQATLDHVVVLNSELVAVIKERSSLESQIEQLTGLVSDLRMRLFAAEAASRQAIEAQGSGCDFAQLVAVGGSMATLIGTGGTAYAAIGPMLAALKTGGRVDANGKPIPAGLKAFKYELETIITVGMNAGDFIKAAQQFSKTLDGEAPSPIKYLPSDNTKILASADQIKQQLQPFMELEAVRKYAQLIEAYVSMAETRNNKIIEYNCNRAVEQDLGGRIDALQIDSKLLSSNIAINTGGKIVGATVFMQKAYLHAKAAVVQALYEMDRCQRFYTLEPAQRFAINDLSIGALSSTALQLAASYRQALTVFGSGLQPYKTSLDLNPIVGTAAFDQFKKTGVLSFSLVPDCAEFKGYCHVLAQRIGVEFIGLKKKVAFRATFTHLGRSRMIDRHGRAHVFSHQSVSTKYQTDKNGVIQSAGQLSGSIDGEGKPDYVGVSPFGPWKLSLEEVEPSQLKSVKSIRIHFETLARSLA